MNAPRPYLLLGIAFCGLFCQVLTPTKAQATDRIPATVIIAQATSSPDRGSGLPWAIAGGVAVVAVGAAAGVYTMGRSAGKQEARVHNAIDEYKKLVDLEPALPSPLEEELAYLKSAQPEAGVAKTVASQPALAIAQPLPTQAVQTPPRPTQPPQSSPLSNQDAPPLSIDDVFGSSPKSTTTIQATTKLQPTVTSIQAPVQTAMQTAPAAAPVAAAPAKATLLVATPPTIGESIEGELVAPQTGQLATSQPASQRATSHSAIVTTQGGGLTTAEPRLPQMGAIEAMMQDLRHTDIEKRRKAIWDLGQRGDSRAVQPLVDLMLDADSKQRSLILSALSEIGTRTLKPMGRALAISLQDENPEVRKNAIRDLTRVYDLIAQISQMVHRATDDPDAEVRDTANWALKQLNRIRPPAMENAGAIANSVSRPESLP
jgi:HEAT repeats